MNGTSKARRLLARLPCAPVFLLMVACLVCASAARADNMIVTQKKGKDEEKIRASRVQFLSGAVKISRVEEAELTIQSDKVLSIEPEQKDSAAEIEHLKEDIESLQKNNAELKEKNRQQQAQLLENQKALNVSASLDRETSVTLLNATISDLKSSLEKKDTALLAKDAVIAQLQPLADSVTRPAQPHLEIGEPSLTTTSLEGVVRVQGRVTNKDALVYPSVVLEVSVLGSASQSLGRTHTFITELGAGATRDFTADLELSPHTPRAGMKAEAAVVMARTTGGEWKASRKKIERNE